MARRRFFEWQVESNETLPVCEGLRGSIPVLVPIRFRGGLSEALVAQHCRALSGCRYMYPGNPAGGWRTCGVSCLGHNRGRECVSLPKKEAHTLSFRSRLYRRGICLLPAAKQQIPRAIKPRCGMTILQGFQTARHAEDAGLDIAARVGQNTRFASNRD